MQREETQQVLELKLKLANAKIVELAALVKTLEEKLPIYVAKKFDRVDEYLGKFINSYGPREKMKILFLREQEGVYRFGTKRVFVKIDI